VSTFPTTGAVASIAAFRAWILSLPIRGTRTIRLYVSSSASHYLAEIGSRAIFKNSPLLHREYVLFFILFSFSLFIVYVLFSLYSVNRKKVLFQFCRLSRGKKGRNARIWLFLIKLVFFLRWKVNYIRDNLSHVHPYFRN